jgi:hypothetical protein
MNDIINLVSIIVVGLSTISFFLSILFLIFDKKNHKRALQVLLISVILFIIGFSSCVATFKLNLE